MYPSSQRPPLIYPDFLSKQALRLSICQIVFGVLCIIFNAVAVGIEPWTDLAGCGFWAGGIFVITGCFGIAASQSRGKCAVTLFSLLCMISAMLTVPLFVISVVRDVNMSRGYYYGIFESQTSTITTAMYQRADQLALNRSYNNRPVVQAMISLMAILAAAEAAAAIWGAIIGSRVAFVCCDMVPDIITKCYLACERASQTMSDQGEQVKIPIKHAEGYTGNPPAFPSTPYLSSTDLLNEGTSHQVSSATLHAGAGKDSLGYTRLTKDH